MKQKFFIGIDVGGTKIAAAAVKPDGTILAYGKYPTPKRAGVSKILSAVVQSIHDLLKNEHLLKKNLQGIGIGIPGIVAHDGRILVTPNTGLSGFSLGRAIQTRFRVKTASGNDVNLGVLGEKWLGAARNSNNILGIFPGTGIGGGVIVDGRLLTGFHGAAGEIGHITVDLKGPKCSCGNHGCLEALAGRWAIERDIHKAVKKGKRTLLKELSNGAWPLIKSKTLSRALKKKDPLTVHIMRKASEALGNGCISLRHVFDPQIIVLGGGLIEACGDFMIPIVQKTIDRDPFFSKVSRCKVVASKLGDNSVILGAVALVKNS